MTIANLSGGRDSTAMVIRWLELENGIDYIVFCDTGYEFDEMYEYIDRLDSYLAKEFNKSITRLDSKGLIDTWAFQYPIQKGEYKGRLRGLPKVVGKEYCTRETKVKPTRDFVIERSPNKFRNTALIGYTHNEVENGRVTNLEYAVSRYPLHEWGWNETEVSDFLAKRQIMNPLYNRFERTGCYICPKQNKTSLFHIFKFYKKEWQIMLDMEERARQLDCVNCSFKPHKSLAEFDREFRVIGSESLFNEIKRFQESETCFCGK